MPSFTVLTPSPHGVPSRLLAEADPARQLVEYTGDRVVFQPKHMSPHKLQDLYYYAWETFYREKNRRGA